jgi:NAD(P)H-nitrite reductase large subunit
MSGSRKSFPLVPAFQAESFTIDNLERIIRILKSYQVKELKFTSGHRLGLSGLTREELACVSHELQQFSTARGNSWYTSLQACPGREYCRYGLDDSETLARRIKEIELPVLPPGKIKVGIAGCGRCCTEPYVRDIGLIAGNTGWTLIFGGNAGGRPRIGDVITEKLTAGQVVELIRRCLTVYQENAGAKMRTARFMEVYGTKPFLEAIFAQPLPEMESE